MSGYRRRGERWHDEASKILEALVAVAKLRDEATSERLGRRWGVSADAARIRMRLARDRGLVESPCGAIPAPWRLTDDGRRWLAERTGGER